MKEDYEDKAGCEVETIDENTVTPENSIDDFSDIIGVLPENVEEIIAQRNNEVKTFATLGVEPRLLKAIDELGFEHPMPIQEMVIPHLLNEDSDAVGLAQTGTGKTAAFGLPLLQRIDVVVNLPQALIIAPTRELCLQIAGDLADFSKYIDGLKILPVYGGSSIESQIRSLRNGVQVIVATPGRLIDLIKRGVVKLQNVHTVVLDEADEMLSMGFQEDLDAILEGIPQEHSTMLFSATMSKEIERIAGNYLHEAHTIQVGSRNEGAENVNHIYYMVHAKDKYLALKRVVDYYPRIYAIVFCRTRMETQEVADNLIRDGYNADALHGDLSQQQRDLTMQKFRHHRTQLLVATDVAARGLDVDDLTHVINYGMPDDVENYTHRSGRTGRAGKKGTSICIIHVRERSKIRLVEKTIQKEFVQGTLPEPKDICAKQLYHVIDEIERVEVDEEEIAQFLPEVAKRWEWLDKEDLIKRVLSREFGRFLQYYANAPEIQVVDTRSAGKGGGKDKGGKERRHGGHAEEGYTRLFLNVGKIDGQFAREIIGLINNNVKGDKVEIGRIDLMKNFSFVEVADRDADRVVKSLHHGVTVKGRSVVADYADHGAKHEGAPAEPSAERKGRAAADKTRKRKYARNDAEKETARGKKFSKEDWMKFLHPDKHEGPDDLPEGWARRKPKKKK